MAVGNERTGRSRSPYVSFGKGKEEDLFCGVFLFVGTSVLG